MVVYGALMLFRVFSRFCFDLLLLYPKSLSCRFRFHPGPPPRNRVAFQSDAWQVSTLAKVLQNTSFEGGWLVFSFQAWGAMRGPFWGRGSNQATFICKKGTIELLNPIGVWKMFPTKSSPLMLTFWGKAKGFKTLTKRTWNEDRKPERKKAPTREDQENCSNGKASPTTIERTNWYTQKEVHAIEKD